MKLYRIRKSNIDRNGRGLYAIKDIKEGTRIIDYVGKIITKKIKEFKPEFILLSAGFDAHKDDPLAQLQLNSRDFYDLTKRTLSLAKLHCNGRVVSILEGGYDLNALQESTEMHVSALLEFS